VAVLLKPCMVLSLDLGVRLAAAQGHGTAEVLLERLGAHLAVVPAVLGLLVLRHGNFVVLLHLGVTLARHFLKGTCEN